MVTRSGSISRTLGRYRHWQGAHDFRMMPEPPDFQPMKAGRG